MLCAVSMVCMPASTRTLVCSLMMNRRRPVRRCSSCPRLRPSGRSDVGGGAVLDDGIGSVDHLAIDREVRDRHEVGHIALDLKPVAVRVADAIAITVAQLVGSQDAVGEVVARAPRRSCRWPDRRGDCRRRCPRSSPSGRRSCRCPAARLRLLTVPLTSSFADAVLERALAFHAGGPHLVVWPGRAGS